MDSKIIAKKVCFILCFKQRVLGNAGKTSFFLAMDGFLAMDLQNPLLKMGILAMDFSNESIAKIWRGKVKTALFENVFENGGVLGLVSLALLQDLGFPNALLCFVGLGRQANWCCVGMVSRF